MPLLCVGLNHHTAPIHVREQLDFTPEQITAVLHSGLTQTPLDELVIISTCNRVELYAAYRPEQVADPVSQLIELLTQSHNLPAAAFTPHLYHYQDTAVMRHLCRVAAGLDSLVIGEPQILGQVTEAFTAAQTQGTIGPSLTALFQAAIRCGKRARSQTRIGHNPASVSSVAVRLAETLVGDLGQARVLVLGAGEMAQLVLKALHQRHVPQVEVINRTYDRAQELANHWGGRAYPWAQLTERLALADLVISSTAAPQMVIDTAVLQPILQQRAKETGLFEKSPISQAPNLLFIDIAVPRDVDPAVTTLPGVHRYDVDDLQQQVETSLQERQEEIPRVAAIIDAEVTLLQQQLRQLQVRPIITDLRLKAEAIRQQELERTRRFLGDVDADDWQRIERLTQALVNKLLHEPTLRLRAEAGNGRADELTDTVRHLFALEES
ncbi:MAG: glutamyl-tRNA reductase [Chloroflexota bacterium]